MTTASRTNLGPLTTTFRPPSSCSLVGRDCATCDYGYQAQTCSDNTANTIGMQDNANCWPPRSNLDVATPAALVGWGFYSPGLICPTGYQTACRATGSVDGGFGFMFSPAPSETAIGCCPTGYTCRFDRSYEVAQTCVSIATASSFPTLQCSSGFIVTTGSATVPISVTIVDSGSALTTSITALTLEAPLFQLMVQATDRITTSTDFSSSATSIFPTSSSSLSATSSLTHAPTTGLSKGAVAGIAIGSVVGGLALLGGLAYLFYRRYNKHKKLGPGAVQYTQAPMDPHTDKPELMADMSGTKYPTPAPMYEAPVTPAPTAELPSPPDQLYTLRSELP